MLLNIFHALQGYLEIEIIGENAEKFLNLSLINKVVLRDVFWVSDTKVIAKVALKDRHKLRLIARQSRCPFHIKKRKGLPFLLFRIEKRKILFIGSIFFYMIFYLLGNLILEIEVRSPYAVESEYCLQVEKLVAEKGIKAGKFTFSFDFDQTENYLLWKLPDLVFADIKKEGNTIVINVVKRIDIDDSDVQKSSGNIIAKTDAVIEDVLVRRGTAIVKKGDTVSKGQILILGYNGKDYVPASGIVKAKVWYKGYGEVPLKEVFKEETGESTKEIFLYWHGEKQILLFGGNEQSYAVFDEVEKRLPMVLWRNITLPVEILIKYCYEQVEYTQNLDADTALQRAVYLAKTASLSRVSPLSEIKSTTIYPIDNVGPIIRVKAVTEAVMDIAEFVATDDIPLDKIITEEN